MAPLDLEAVAAVLGILGTIGAAIAGSVRWRSKRIESMRNDLAMTWTNEGGGDAAGPAEGGSLHLLLHLTHGELIGSLASPQSDTVFDVHAQPGWFSGRATVSTLLCRTMVPIATASLSIKGNHNRLKWRTRKRFDEEAADFLPHKTMLWPSPLTAEDVERFGSAPEVQRQIERGHGSDFFPVGGSSTHALIPKIGGLPYVEARALLIEAGWQPLHQHWSYESDSRIQSGNGPSFWARGYREIESASGTGLAHYVFVFRDACDTVLEVVTAGEVLDEAGTSARVANWRIRAGGTAGA